MSYGIIAHNLSVWIRAKTLNIDIQSGYTPKLSYYATTTVYGIHLSTRLSMATFWKEILRFFIVTNFVILTVGTLTLIACIPRPLSEDTHDLAWIANQPLLSIASSRIDKICNVKKSNQNRQFSTFFLLAILLSGDIHQNPGPSKFPCTSCDKSVKHTDKALMCDNCENWCHIYCDEITPEKYSAYQENDTLSYECNLCRLPPFSDSFFDDTNHSSIGNISTTSSVDGSDTPSKKRAKMIDN